MKRARAIATSTWSDALDSLGIEGVITGLTIRAGSGRIAGDAVTVKESAGTFPIEAFAVADFLEAIEPGSILAIDVGGEAVSSFGGLASLSAVLSGAAGVLIDGACRDIGEIHDSGLWLASRAVTPLSGKGRIKTEGINVAVRIGEVTVEHGDVMVADETGIVRISAARFEEALAIAEDLTIRDKDFASALRKGASFRAAAERLKHL